MGDGGGGYASGSEGGVRVSWRLTNKRRFSIGTSENPQKNKKRIDSRFNPCYIEIVTEMCGLK